MIRQSGNSTHRSHELAEDGVSNTLPTKPCVRACVRMTSEWDIEALTEHFHHRKKKEREVPWFREAGNANYKYLIPINHAWKSGSVHIGSFKPD